jgi:hypothetical protein
VLLLVQYSKERTGFQQAGAEGQGLKPLQTRLSAQVETLQLAAGFLFVKQYSLFVHSAEEIGRILLAGGKRIEIEVQSKKE